jgi:hypothetical protein
MDSASGHFQLRCNRITKLLGDMACTYTLECCNERNFSLQDNSRMQIIAYILHQSDALSGTKWNLSVPYLR